MYIYIYLYVWVLVCLCPCDQHVMVFPGMIKFPQEQHLLKTVELFKISMWTCLIYSIILAFHVFFHSVVFKLSNQYKTLYNLDN